MNTHATTPQPSPVPNTDLPTLDQVLYAHAWNMGRWLCKCGADIASDVETDAEVGPLFRAHYTQAVRDWMLANHDRITVALHETLSSRSDAARAADVALHILTQETHP